MPSRNTSALHRFRQSTPGARYFITCCTEGRQIGLTNPKQISAIHQVIAGFEGCGDVETFAATVMPDHFHWRFALGSRLAIGRVLARFKAQTRAALADQSLQWQRDFFEHRVRLDERVEHYGVYIFLNSYRASLVRPNEKWPGWYCPKPKFFEFTALLAAGETPPPEWIGFPVPAGLMTGE